MLEQLDVVGSHPLRAGGREHGLSGKTPPASPSQASFS